MLQKEITSKIMSLKNARWPTLHKNKSYQNKMADHNK